MTLIFNATLSIAFRVESFCIQETDLFAIGRPRQPSQRVATEARFGINPLHSQLLCGLRSVVSLGGRRVGKNQQQHNGVARNKRTASNGS